MLYVRTFLNDRRQQNDWLIILLSSYIDRTCTRLSSGSGGCFRRRHNKSTLFSQMCVNRVFLFLVSIIYFQKNVSEISQSETVSLNPSSRSKNNLSKINCKNSLKLTCAYTEHTLPIIPMKSSFHFILKCLASSFVGKCTRSTMSYLPANYPRSIDPGKCVKALRPRKKGSLEDGGFNFWLVTGGISLPRWKNPAHTLRHEHSVRGTPQLFTSRTENSNFLAGEINRTTLYTSM